MVGAAAGSAGAVAALQPVVPVLPRFANTVPGPLAESPIAKQKPEDDSAVITRPVVLRTSTDTFLAVIESAGEARKTRLGSAPVRPVAGGPATPTNAAVVAP